MLKYFHVIRWSTSPGCTSAFLKILQPLLTCLLPFVRAWRPLIVNAKKRMKTGRKDEMSDNYMFLMMSLILSLLYFLQLLNDNHLPNHLPDLNQRLSPPHWRNFIPRSGSDQCPAACSLSRKAQIGQVHQLNNSL